MTIRAGGASEISMARALARAALAVDLSRFDADVIAKAKICLLDFLSCAFEARNHPWSRQAIGIAREVSHGATIVGTGKLATAGDAAFANATMGHGLVREDMHAASICHHGVVIWPTLLALSERTPLSGATFLAAAIIGYETGAQIGRALFTADLARLYRPTGLVAPLGAALAGSYALGLSEDAATSAIAIAANTSSGLNEWPRSGGSEMYFHPGFAARNAVAAVELAEAGARASETILEGEAGLFAAFRRQPAPAAIRLFAGERPEIMAVYNKPAPACNFAQTAAQAALRVAREIETSEDIATVSIRVPEAAARYPGCDSTGPFHNALQAKMSIPFSVAAVLARGALEEDNYADINDPRVLRLVACTDLQSEAGFTAAFPANQGAEVLVGLRNGKTVRQRLDNVIAATPEEIRACFRLAAADAIGERRALRLEELVDNCAQLSNSSVIAAQCRPDPAEQRLRPAS
ncbi:MULTISPECIES: MmgE/PrpD family protein [Bradyrhizobium]|uniref:2-methylcitrate dehydratase PrpD n=2 Tax=Bradyrhizobium TaxID=374 RepID=A0ABY0P9L9_9BRAD|nr:MULTISPECIES: MmgE/PrpD family protein [Bradyrhizobium]SDH76568.1 2-methylcitrate dehydratase PrpD [Bradyrhizobium ottawaense]SEE08388.1 2-methylcitrate dehydratase PrpD [Bradyrhizobium lablabi]SHM04010.1 2-methylcitrate dehydratase PrpD [Bradyrhizobium lablabi]